jgi:peptide-methionine (S)-S-oxide reductase
MRSLLNKSRTIDASQALPGSAQAMPLENRHYVLQTPLKPPFPDDCSCLLLGMGCFWGAERLFWQQAGVFSTAVGYAGGYTPNPSYRELCSGLTGHAEVVLVVYRHAEIALSDLLKWFWESHDPTQGMRQGNDIGTQYRSCLYTYSETQLQTALLSRAAYQAQLSAHRRGEITTEIGMVGEFYYAEQEHQQYLAKQPDGYCGLRGSGILMPDCY